MKMLCMEVIQFLRKPFLLKPPEILRYYSGCVSERGRGKQRLYDYELKIDVTNVKYVFTKYFIQV